VEVAGSPPVVAAPTLCVGAVGYQPRSTIVASSAITLPESQPLLSARSFAESNPKKLSTKKTLPRAKQKKLSAKKNTRQKGFFAQSPAKNPAKAKPCQRNCFLSAFFGSQQRFFAECIFRLSTKNLNIHFLPSKLFLSSTHLYQTHAQIWHTFNFVCYISQFTSWERIK
jgi:hypothetical protein